CRPRSRSSVWMALLPVISMLETDGRSTRSMTSTPPSRPRRMSWKKPVRNRAREASTRRRSSTLSPTLSGSAEKTLPAETRCRPLTRISLTTKDSAWASAIRRAAIAAGSRRFMKSLTRFYVATERPIHGLQPPQVIEQGQQHDTDNQGDTNLHGPGLHPLRQRLAPDPFVHIKEQVPAIQHGYRQQVEN